MRQQMRDLYYALWIAYLADRVLVLPRLQCHCVHNWFETQRCRLPGDNVTRLPFTCPMVRPTPAPHPHTPRPSPPGSSSRAAPHTLPRVWGTVPRTWGATQCSQTVGAKWAKRCVPVLLAHGNAAPAGLCAGPGAAARDAGHHEEAPGEPRLASFARRAGRLHSLWETSRPGGVCCVGGLWAGLGWRVLWLQAAASCAARAPVWDSHLFGQLCGGWGPTCVRCPQVREYSWLENPLTHSKYKVRSG